MPLDNPKGGFGYAAEFQSSALPWLTSSQAPNNGSPVEIDFQTVARFITIGCTSAVSTDKISFGVTLNGIKGGNRVVINAGQTLTFEWRVQKIWVQAENGNNPAYTIGAGLTTVLTMPQLSGTLMDGSPGWQGVG